MGKGKTHVFLVKPQEGLEGSPRLIRGTLREVEAKLREEVSIEPCTAEQAHGLNNVEIEQAGE